MVARYRSFAEAARILPRGSAQSLHKRVRELERRQNLALKLLRSRGMKGVELTEAGRRIYEFIDPFFRGMDGLITGIQTDDTGSLSVGMSPFGTEGFGFRIFRDFRRAFPKVTVTVRSGLSSEVMDMVVGGEVDIGIFVAPERSAGLVLTGHVPVDCQLLVRSNQLRPREFRTWEDLLENPLVLPCRGSALRENIDRFLARRRLSTKLWIAAEVTSTQQVVEAVRSGLGVGVIPEVPGLFAVQKGVHRLRAPEGLPLLAMGVFHKERDPLPAYMRAFLAFARSALTQRTLTDVTPVPVARPLPNAPVQ